MAVSPHKAAMNSVSRTCAALLLLATLIAGCNERPVDIAPEVYYGTWEPVPAPVYANLQAVASTGQGDTYVVAEDGGLHRANGSSLVRVDGAPDDIEDIWGAGGDTLFVLAPTLLYRYDGATFAPIFESAGSQFRSIRVAGDRSIFILGWKEVFGFDGSAWRQDSLWVYSLWPFASDRALAGGRDGVVWWFDGIEWTSQQTCLDEPIWSLWGSSPGDVYAVSGDDVCHFDGSQWQSIPFFDSYGVELVTGSASDDVHIWGNTVFHHFDGVDWKTLGSPTAMGINSIWARGPTDAIAVGEEGKIVRYDGGQWRSGRGGTPRHVDVVFGLDERHIYVGGTDYGDRGVVFEYDGAGFCELPQASPGLYPHGLWGDAPDNLYCAGAAGVHRFDGTRWHREDVGVNDEFEAIVGTPDGALFAVGYGGNLIRKSDIGWAMLLKGKRFYDVWASSANHAVAVARGAEILHFNNGVWTTVETGEYQLHSVWGTSPSNVYVGGDDTILHFDGSTWSKEVHHGTDQWWSIAGNGPDDVYVCGDNEIMHFDGAVWSRVARWWGYPFVRDSWSARGGFLYWAAGSEGLYRFRRRQ